MRMISSACACRHVLCLITDCPTRNKNIFEISKMKSKKRKVNEKSDKQLGFENKKFRGKPARERKSKKNHIKLSRRESLIKQINDDVLEKNPRKIPVDPRKVAKYDRGEKLKVKSVPQKLEKEKLLNKEKKILFGAELSAKSELLLTEEGGFLEPDEDENEITAQFTQTEIQNSVDASSASKRFDLDLNDFGPYRMNYSRNGRFLLLGGRKGHVSALDWMKKKLLCEINVMDSAYDVTWLHQESFFAVAQKKWVYIYDSQGVEIHCLKQLFEVFKMTFLPYHFLLATVSQNNIISWLDTSIGEIVQQFRIKAHGLASTVAQHPANALISIGLPSGVVNFYSPNNNKPAVTKWCHKQGICSIAFDPRGTVFATSSLDRSLKLWDARNLSGPTEEYRLRTPATSMSISHQGVLAIGTGNTVQIYNNKITDSVVQKNVYLRHKVPRTISNLEFCPFEDVLGVGHATGFSSLLVPGSGEANFDALEVNPFRSKSQRREAEVQALLGKIPYDLITWDPTELRKVHVPSLTQIVEEKKKLLHVKPPKINIEPKKKQGKRGGAANANKRKKILVEQTRRDYVKQIKGMDPEDTEDNPENEESTSVLDRFKRKTSRYR